MSVGSVINFCLLFLFLILFKNAFLSGMIILTPIQFLLMFYALMLIFALFILKWNVAGIFIESKQTLVNKSNSLPRFLWQWKNSWLLFPVIAGFWAIPIIYGAFITEISIREFSAQSIIYYAILQILVVGVAEELFFRESAVIVFKNNLANIIILSSAFFFILHIVQGIVPALIAVGGGFIYLSLRLAGVNILLIALAHGVSNVIFARIISISLVGVHLWLYIAFLLIGTSLIAFMLIKDTFPVSKFRAKK